VLDRHDREGHPQMGLPNARWTLDEWTLNEERLLRPHPGTRGERLDPASLHGGPNGEVGTCDRLAHGQSGQAQ
jgi:hypothetical protein